MTQQNRFQDRNLTLDDFDKETWVVCPSCSQKAVAKVDFESNSARLYCVQCGYNKETTTAISRNATVKMAAPNYFGAELWLQASFKNDVFYAFNGKHLDNLESYIGAGLREHKNRTHFTLLEKLPKFYHEAKNREDLLKLIAKLKNK